MQCAASAALLATWAYGAPLRAADLSLSEQMACPNGSELGFLAEQALGRPLGAVPGPRFVVSTEQLRDGFAARLEATTPADPDASRVRTFSAPTCEELVETVALAVAIAIGAPQKPALASEAASERVQPEPQVEERLPEARGAEAEETAHLEPESPIAAPAVAAMAWAVGDRGTLPGPSWGVALGGALEWSALELRLMGLWLSHRHQALDDPAVASKGADIGLLAGSALVCAPLELHASDLELGACAGWELGRLTATGTGVTRPHQKGTLWSAPRIDLGARWPVPRTSLWLELAVTVAAPLLRDEFILKDIGSVYRPPDTIVRASLGIGWRSD